MDTLEAIRTRRSVRRFTDAPIPSADLETIVDAGRLAATGNNRQPWDFVIVTDRAMIASFMIAGAWDRAGRRGDRSGHGSGFSLVGGGWSCCHREYAFGSDGLGIWHLLGGRRCSGS
jgi:nitroreductase